MKRIHIRLARRIAAAAMLLVAAGPVPAGAVQQTYADNIPATLTGPNIGLVIVAGSTSESLDIQATTVTVQVAAGEAFTLRYPGPNPGRMPNNGGLPECNYVGGNNDIVVSGPKTVIFTPNTTVCGAAGGGSLPASVVVVKPNGSESWKGGSSQLIFWSSAGGSEAHAMRLELSTDGGNSYPTLIAENEHDDGAFAWTVPDMATAQARLRVKTVVAGGTVRAQDVSDADFAITSAAPTAPPAPAELPLAPAPYDPDTAAVTSQTISVDKDLPSTAGEQHLAHELLKLPSDNDPATAVDSAVYYCGRDGKRYVFPNPKIFSSWYADFGSVQVVDAATMASMPLGGNVTYRPGVRLVKITTDSKVYAVGKNGILRWVTTEAVAARLYGPDWNRIIDDVSDAFFVNYRTGEPIY